MKVALQLSCLRMPAAIHSFSYVWRLSCSLVFKDACSESLSFIRMKVVLQLSFQGCLQRVTRRKVVLQLFKDACSDSLILIRVKVVLQLSFQGCLQRVTHFHSYEGCSLVFKDACSDSFMFARRKVILQLTFQGCLQQRFTHFHNV